MKQIYDIPKDVRTKKEGVTYGEMQLISYQSSVTQSIRNANVILPPGYSQQEKYPVVYMLHGIGGDEEEWLGANPVEMLGNLMANGEIPKMIAVLPNVRARKDDRKDPDDIFTLEHFHAFDSFITDLTECLMPYMKEHFSILEGREHTAICGLSMGGRETLYISCTHPELFAYVGAFSPAIGVLPYANPFMSEPGLLTEETLKWSVEYPTFIMIATGDQDMVVRTEPERYHKALEKNGTDHIFYVTEGAHDFVVWSHGLFNFLKKIFR
ncbi:MAG: alpha/beta hydrolase-fold protein [Eubacteriales bacterium]|nr:alpha/beta hydrolase-fold protein [Eubacteriales bacterium]